MSGWEWQEAVFQWVSLKVAEWEARHWTVASQIRPIPLAGVAEQDTGPQRRSAWLGQTAATSLLSSFPPHCHSPVSRCCRPNGAGACASSSGSSECFVARCASSQRRGNPSSESMSESANIRRAAHPQNTPQMNRTRLRGIKFKSAAVHHYVTEAADASTRLLSPWSDWWKGMPFSGTIERSRWMNAPFLNIQRDL